MSLLQPRVWTRQVTAAIPKIAEGVDIVAVRLEIDALMTEKLQLLTPEIVKRLMEEVIKEHLGWLIVRARRQRHCGGLGWCAFR